MIKNRQIKTTKIDKELFINNLFKMGYSKKFSKKVSKDKSLNYITKAFQRRYRQGLIDGKIDRECLIISKNLVKKPH